MPANYVLIQEITLSATASSITFSNIPQTGYDQLVLKVNARSDRTAISTPIIVKPNNDALTAYETDVYSSGATPYSSASAGALYMGNIPAASSTAGNFSCTELNINGYRTGYAKTISSETHAANNSTSNGGVDFVGARWSNNTAISSLVITAASGNFVAGSSFSLYGIAAYGNIPSSYPKAIGGDTIINDGTYWIHTFYNSSLFVPYQNLTADALVVGGGGGGGFNGGGGGGAGGYRTASSLNFLQQTNYSVTIGAGGEGGVGTYGGYGSSSTISTITSSGGGRGANGGNNGGTGGSGGGGGYSGAGFGLGAAGNAGGYSPSEGNNGANGQTGGWGGGGGGSSSAGSVGGGAGSGTANSITGTSITYAVGGSGGYGGSGGPAGSSATINTGNGGGGGYNAANGGAGGSGIVVIKYLMA